jgi:hypothetical protein
VGAEEGDVCRKLHGTHYPYGASIFSSIITAACR